MGSPNTQAEESMDRNTLNASALELSSPDFEVLEHLLEYNLRYWEDEFIRGIGELSISLTP